MEEVKKLDNADEILEVPVLYSERMKEIGREEGREEEREEVALEMLRDGLSIERIMKYTLLKKGQIEKLKSKL